MLQALRFFHRILYWRKAGCVFIHVPKSAGTSINYALYGRTLGHYTYAEVYERWPCVLEQCYVFSVVRDPYDRLVSAYKFARAGVTKDMGISNPGFYQTHEFRSFRSFVVEWLVYQDLNTVDHVFRPQYLYLCVSDKVMVDHVCRLENLSKDLEVVQEKMGRILTVEERNVTSSGENYANYYDDELYSVVYKLYEKDFLIFNYQKRI
jgi:hypothetical protein